jgi:hypothetical protein
MRKIEAEKADVVPDGGLARQGINTVIGFQIGILFAERGQGGVGHLVGAGHIFPHAKHEKSRVGTLHRDCPAGFVLFAL